MKTSIGLCGATGKTPELQIGQVKTVEHTQKASVEITGTRENPVLNFNIPKGKDGAKLILKEKLLGNIEIVNDINEITTSELNSVLNMKGLKELKKSLDKSIKINTDDVKIINKRIDNIISIKEGSTTGDAELIDGRTGFDGSIYDSIGDAIRTQTQKLSREIADKLDTPQTVAYENVKIGHNTIGDINNFRGWCLPIFEINNGLIHFKYESENGNSGIRTNDFIPVYNNIEITTHISEITTGGLSLNLAYIKQDGQIAYKQIVTYNETGEFNKNICVSDFKEIDFSKSVYLVYANMGVTNVKFTFKVVESALLESDFIKKDLQSTLKVIANKLNANGYDNVVNNDTIIGDTNTLTIWGSPIYTIDKSYVHYKYTSDDGNNGLRTQPFKPTETFIGFSFEITEISKGSLCLYVMGKDENGATLYLKIREFHDVGKYKEIIDLNNLVVYRNLDLTKDIQVLVANNVGQVETTFKDFLVYENKYLNNASIKNTLGDTLVSLDAEIQSVKSEISTPKKQFVVAPNGNKFMLSISDDGSFNSVPLIPNKTLFIGNSLLLGHGTFGMCASNSRSDYYHYVSEYIKTLNSKVTIERQQGSGFEGCTDMEQVNDWINQNINNKDNDFNLVYVQLGDNVNTTDKTNNFKTSCKYLLQYLRNKFKNARIIWVGMWYGTAEKLDIITNACSETGCEFIDITDLSTITENKAKIGYVVNYDDGTSKPVTSSGVASHPSDVGMKKIADRIIEKTFKGV